MQAFGKKSNPSTLASQFLGGTTSHRPRVAPLFLHTAVTHLPAKRFHHLTRQSRTPGPQEKSQPIDTHTVRNRCGPTGGWHTIVWEARSPPGLVSGRAFRHRRAPHSPNSSPPLFTRGGPGRTLGADGAAQLTNRKPPASDQTPCGRGPRDPCRRKRPAQELLCTRPRPHDGPHKPVPSGGAAGKNGAGSRPAVPVPGGGRRDATPPPASKNVPCYSVWCENGGEEKRHTNTK